MGKINCHCHSIYSDGEGTIEELAKAHEMQDFDAMVITDHCYPNMYIDTVEFERQRIECEKVSKELDYPIIQGIELSVWYEEVLVFGTEVIKKILETNAGEFKDTYERVWTLLDVIKQNKDKCAIILCHPGLSPRDTPLKEDFYNKLFPLLDGFEEYNSGINWFKNREVPKELLDKKRFRNSDAHWVQYVNKGDNHSEFQIINEEDLIKFIKS